MIEAESIKRIRAELVRLEKILKTFIPQESSNRYGQEEEYSLQSIKVDLQLILSDLRILTEPNNIGIFVQLSVFSERKDIYTNLASISRRLSNDNHNVTMQLDLLKVTIRNYKIRGSAESQDDIHKRIAKLRVESDQLKETLRNVSDIEKTARIDARDKIQEAEKRYSVFSGLVEKLTKKSDSLDSFERKLGELHRMFPDYEKTIKELLSSSEKSRDESVALIKHIESQKQATDKYKEYLELTTNQYKKHLDSYQEEHEKSCKEAVASKEEVDSLIKNSKLALEFTTAEGISAAYNEKYKQASKWYNFIGWMIGALFFVLASIGFSYWRLKSGAGSIPESGWELVIFRLSTIPLLITAAIFCASRYVKNKNLAEDYSYKSVLAKSMMAFMEKIAIASSDKSDYARAILNQILQDPLRKRHDEGTTLENVGGVFKGRETPSETANKTV